LFAYFFELVELVFFFLELRSEMLYFLIKLLDVLLECLVLGFLLFHGLRHRGHLLSLVEEFHRVLVDVLHQPELFFFVDNHLIVDVHQKTRVIQHLRVKRLLLVHQRLKVDEFFLGELLEASEFFITAFRQGLFDFAFELVNLLRYLLDLCLKLSFL